MRMTLRQWGNSLAVRIPKAFAVELGMEPGKTVEITSAEQKIVITNAEPSLEELLQQVHPQNLHSETVTGPVTGAEVW